jgi:hypothetical protein
MDIAEKIKKLEKKLDVVEKKLAENEARGHVTGIVRSAFLASAWCRLTDEIERLKERQKLGGGE